MDTKNMRKEFNKKVLCIGKEKWYKKTYL